MARKRHRGTARGLEIEERPDVQRRRWAFERVAWGCFGLVSIGGLAGVMGSGPLASASAVGPSGRERVEYQRFLRVSVPTSLRFVVPPGGGELTIRLPEGYARRMAIDEIRPAPSRSSQDAHGTTWTFVSPPGGEPAVVQFRVRPLVSGSLGAEASVAGATLRLRHFVWP